ncbi:hypothetical protein PM082_016203 [Marasmius tenuissimus]|nr:hypothetical protein PM082_016203 [Marasmius tenuissimus]
MSLDVECSEVELVSINNSANAPEVPMPTAQGLATDIFVERMDMYNEYQCLLSLCKAQIECQLKHSNNAANAKINTKAQDPFALLLMKLTSSTFKSKPCYQPAQFFCAKANDKVVKRQWEAARVMELNRDMPKLGKRVVKEKFEKLTMRKRMIGCCKPERFIRLSSELGRPR